jgi:tetratricopeptide (TPR) repeat protein
VRRVALALTAALLCGCPRRAAPPSPADAALTAEQAFLHAKFELEQGRRAEAMRLFREAALGAPTPELKANALLGLGSALSEAGDHKQALTAYEEVATLRPDEPDAWRVLAYEAHTSGAREAEARALEHLVALQPDSLSAYLDLAGVDVALGRVEQSKDVYLRYEARRKDLILELAAAKEPKEREAACEALSGAKDATTARALVLALTDRAPSVRRACLEAIGRLGVDVDPEIRPALKAYAARERDPQLKRAAEEALR